MLYDTEMRLLCKRSITSLKRKFCKCFFELQTAQSDDNVMYVFSYMEG